MKLVSPLYLTLQAQKKDDMMLGTREHIPTAVSQRSHLLLGERVGVLLLITVGPGP